MLSLPNCGNKMLITLLEYAETISQLSISLNGEMIYEMNHQVTYNPRSCEWYLYNCIYRSLKKCGNKRLITLLEFAETISQLSISLNGEMIYEMNHQVSYDPHSYESNLCNCLYRSLKKVRTSTGSEPVTSRYRCDALTN